MKADVIIFVLMAVFGEVPQPEVDQACEEREVALERALEGWEIYSSREFSDLFLQKY